MKKSLVVSLALTVLAGVLFYGDDAIAFVTDVGIIVPPNYLTFVPPPAGGRFIDPAFGTRVTRISDAANTRREDDVGVLPWVEAEYSTKSPFNADNSKILLLEFSYFSLYDGVTLQRIKPLCCQGEIVFASSEPLWSRTDPNVFYFHPVNSNQLKSYNVATNVVSVVRTFSEYRAISAQGESEMSHDGNHIVLAGDGNENRPLPRGGTLRSNMHLLRQVANHNGHKHLIRDVDGREILVQNSSADPTPIPNCRNAIVKIGLATAHQSCLLQLDFSLAAQITAPDQGEWIFAATYNGTRAPSPWFAYTNELLQIKLDGTEVRRLVHHRSDTATYDGQPVRVQQQYAGVHDGRLYCPCQRSTGIDFTNQRQ